MGAPDLHGDGKSDLLVLEPSRRAKCRYWGCDLGHQQVNSYNGDFAQVQDTTWHLMGSEDTNGDGHPDLIWWNASSGDESRWLTERHHGDAVRRGVHSGARHHLAAYRHPVGI